MAQDLYTHPDYYQLDELLTDEHKMIRDMVRAWIKKEVSPNIEEWAQHNKFPSHLVKQMGELGVFGPTIPAEYGGGGLDYISYGIMMQEIERCDSGMRSTASVQGSLVMFPIYEYGSEEQRKKYLPKLASGEWLGCFGLTEPDFGSNPGGMVTNFKDMGDHYLLNGAKMWISNAPFADIAVVWAKDESGRIHGLVVERGMEGFERGKNLDKIGMKAQDTAELFFRDVKVPIENLLGKEGHGFYYLMHNLPQERLSIAAAGVAAAESALEMTIQYCKDRTAFGRQIGKFQNSRFKLAEMKTEITIARTFVDQCIIELNNDKLSVEKAAMAKYWVTDLQCKVIDECLQLHGGYGYMTEYPIARAYTDSRVQRIYGGTNEIMKEIIGRSMGF